MLAPLSWLRDYAEFDQPLDVLAERLSDLGLVVDGVRRLDPELPGVVVARILDIRAHPDADRIRLVDVDAGDGETLQIACGAWNMAVGDLVPLARIGAVLPSGMEIARRKMRGQWSNGMLCSPEEIGQPAVPGSDGLLILPPDSAAPGAPVADALGGADAVFDLDISPNRPDALSMAGVARDLAASLGLAYHPPAGTPAGPVTPVAVDPGVERAGIDVEAPDLCGRFTATVLRGVRVGPSPGWLARRLTLAGMRPINLVVDVSNYVMLDLGQPNHAYDLDVLAGHGLLVRRAHAGETLVTLDGVERLLLEGDLVICDGEGRPVGLAGVMGGAAAEISEATTSVLLEAAWFQPAAVAATGKRLGIPSEARHRFERGVDPEVAPAAVARFAELLAAAGVPDAPPFALGPTVDVRSDTDLPRRETIRLRPGRVNALLGTDLDAATIARHLRALGCDVRDGDPATTSMQVSAPSWRPDLEREVDLVEEVARLHGYRNIERTLPRGAPGRGLNSYQRERRRVRDILVGAGYDEAWTSTFLSSGDLAATGLAAPAVQVTNPLDADECLLRPALLPGLLHAARSNAEHQQPEVRLFEVGHVFAPPPDDAGPTPLEAERLGALASGTEAGAVEATRLWRVLAEGLRLAEASLVRAEHPGLHPTRCATVLGADGRQLGVVGEVDPDVAARRGVDGRLGYLELDLGLLLAEARRPRVAEPVRRFPASDLDLALVVADEVSAAEVATTLRAAGADLLESLRLFDVYRDPERLGPGLRSLAFRLRLRAADHTLTDAERSALRDALVAAVAGAHGAGLRS
jgi:phenylalanyl-tRNA synthetase beta chain